MNIKYEIRKLLWKIGYDITKFTPESHPLARRKQIFDAYEIDTVLDIGANTGQFARQIRNDLGYTKRIISFEPLGSAFEVLKLNSEGDPNWKVINIALGDTETKQEINVAANSYSSSLLDILPSQLKAAPESRTIGQEEIEVKRLDTIFDDFCKPTDKIYMKLDTQGFEGTVLKGAEVSLKQIDTLHMEMSLLPLFEGELLFHEMCSLMYDKGYLLIAIEPGISDQESGQLLQVDGIFHRS